MIIKETLSLANRKQRLLLSGLMNSIDNTFDSHCSFHHRISTGFTNIYPPVLLDDTEGPWQASGPHLREVGTAARSSRL